ncbi:MAG: S49 family peptidase, partial [Parvularculaceae bacterium]|nr:S49 family peptidase [Parvularculaceae bacterium]
VVLRVDSPGGSAFASEIIRQEVLALKAAGKPVVVSMGSLAASGGYWISAGADKIYASPYTITGSIGIFGFFPTFENLAGEWGVNTDGVGTTTLSPLMASGLGPLPPEGADIIQRSIENGYQRFLETVASGRKMSTADVDKIAQGRVWIGSTAKDLKLVDAFGSIDDAVKAAAAMAKLEKYEVKHVTGEKSPFASIFGNASARLMTLAGVDETLERRNNGALAKVMREADAVAEFSQSFNDPKGMYARCLACEM